MELVVNILLALLSAYIVYVYYRIFFELKRNSIVTKVIICMFLIWQVISVPSLVPIPSVVRLPLSIAFVFVMGTCFIGSALGKIVFAILYTGVWALSELLVGSIFLMINLDVTENTILGMLICEVYLLLLVKLLQLFFGDEAVRNVTLKESGILMLIPIAFLLVSFFIFTVCAEIGSKTYMILAITVFILLMIAMLVVFVMYIRLMESHEIKRRVEIYQKELELHTEYIKEKEHIISVYNKTKHDLKNNLIYMLELLCNKEYESLEKYIRDITEVAAPNKSGISNTDNTILDSFVNYKYDLATENGIKFTAKLEIPFDMSFDNGDLCVILGNALDNAIEANADRNIENPYINLMMRYGEGNLIIIIENSFDGRCERKKDGRLITTKKNKRYHGIGLSSIQNAILKYNGQMNVEIEEKKFKLSIIMYG